MELFQARSKDVSQSIHLHMKKLFSAAIVEIHLHFFQDDGAECTKEARHTSLQIC